MRVCIRPTRDNKTIADIEKARWTARSADFTGRCVRKGKAIFVEPDLPQLNRWLFIPPHARNGIKEGDYVRCAILRHPDEATASPQAKVLNGDRQRRHAGHREPLLHGQAPAWGPLNGAAASRKEPWNRRIAECQAAWKTERRRDLTDLEFVSIDAAKTQDIDDALYAEISSDGWTLFVAIADPTSYIPVPTRTCTVQGRRRARHLRVLPRGRAADAARGAVARTPAPCPRVRTGPHWCARSPYRRQRRGRGV